MVIAATRLLTELDGAFLCARYDATTRRVTFVGDFFRALPAYVAVDDRGVAVASTIRAFPCTGLVAPRPDPAGWGAFIGAKHFIGDDTSIAGVMQYPAATVLEYDVRRDHSTSRVYWRWPDADPRVTMSRVDTRGRRDPQLGVAVPGNRRHIDTAVERRVRITSAGRHPRRGGQSAGGTDDRQPV
jgi:asparagine synthetase B (glutamine-hydrolysing)